MSKGKQDIQEDNTSLLSKMQNYIKKWKENQGLGLKLAESIVNSKNTLSQLLSKQENSVYIPTPNTIIQISDEVQNNINALKKHQDIMFNYIEKLSELKEKIFEKNENDSDDDIKSIIDYDCLINVITQLQQQQLLEMSVYDRLSNMESNQSYDENEIITLLSCFSKTPYIEIDEVNALLALQI